VARTQLRALVEEKENINTYLSEHLAASFGLRFILSCFGLRVADPGCLSGMSRVCPRSRISNPTTLTKEEGENICCIV
jgi:hypothetical protein